jgi:RimJ/RimL family protein N-acetyltransferase
MEGRGDDGPTLKTARTLLRPLSMSDVEEAHALWTDPGVRKYLWDDVVIDRERVAEVVAHSCADFAERRYGLWAIHRHGSPELIGFCGLRASDGGQPELLFGIRPPWWGQRLAGEAAVAVLDYAFSVLGHTKVEAATDVPNRASIRVLQRLGMICVRRGLLNGRDTLFYELAKDASPRLYSELAGWFHLLTAPAEYAEEAAAYRDALRRASPTRLRTLLELGSGGGNNAFHLKRDFECTLSDLSPAMLETSRRINPECAHVAGDMRSLRLGRAFDAVFVHDAVMYLTNEDDLRRAVETAFAHCRPGGVALFAPDFVRETFRPGTDHGGHDGEGRALRYLEWVWDPDPADTTYLTDFAYLLREDGKEPRVLHDRHVEGLFPRATWLRLLQETGFQTSSATRPNDDGEPDEVFVGVRR